MAATSGDLQLVCLPRTCRRGRRVKAAATSLSSTQDNVVTFGSRYCIWHPQKHVTAPTFIKRWTEDVFVADEAGTKGQSCTCTFSACDYIGCRRSSVQQCHEYWGHTCQPVQSLPGFQCTYLTRFCRIRKDAITWYKCIICRSCTHIQHGCDPCKSEHQS